MSLLEILHGSMFLFPFGVLGLRNSLLTLRDFVATVFFNHGLRLKYLPLFLHVVRQALFKVFIDYLNLAVNIGSLH